MSKRILVFESWNKSPQFETGLELAELHAEAGDDATYVNIGGKLPFLEWHRTAKKGILKRLCKGHFDTKIARARMVVNPLVKIYGESTLTAADRKIIRKKYHFSSLEELKAFEWNGIEIGMATASSLISMTNDLSPDTIKYRELVESILHSSLIVAITFERYLEKVKPDLVYFRNGRVAVYRPVLRLCQQKQIAFKVHDRACDKYHYSLGNDIRHNFAMINEQIHNHWEGADPVKKYSVAEEYYTARRRGQELHWRSFVKKQVQGKLPEDWDRSKYNIVYFTSSMSEYAAVSVGINLNILFESQPKSVIEIAEFLSGHPDIHFYVRLHPNLLNQSENEKNAWFGMKHPNIRFIDPNSPISTYTLVDEANLSISYRSTVSIEASFSEKPTIILSRSWFENLNAVHIPNSKQHLFEMLSSKNLQALPKEGSCMYGYYMKTYGIRHKYYEATSLHAGHYKGVNLQEPTKALVLYDKTKKKLKNVRKRLLG